MGVSAAERCTPRRGVAATAAAASFQGSAYTVGVDPVQASPTAPGRRSPSARIAEGLLIAAWLAALFGSAGTLAWPAGWTYVVVLVLGQISHRRHVAVRNPAVLERRDRIGAGTEKWDLVWVAIFWPLMVSASIVAGADTVRFGTRPLADWLVVPGALVYFAGMALSATAMAANPFFEGTVRLQPGQHVVDGGPYRRLRHPGYAGLALWALSSPLLLRSGLAFVPAALAAAWVVLRTALEDRLLRRGLPGYQAYAARVRWRLIPWLW